MCTSFGSLTGRNLSCRILDILLSLVRVDRRQVALLPKLFPGHYILCELEINPERTNAGDSWRLSPGSSLNTVKPINHLFLDLKVPALLIVDHLPVCAWINLSKVLRPHFTCFLALLEFGARQRG